MKRTRPPAAGLAQQAARRPAGARAAAALLSLLLLLVGGAVGAQPPEPAAVGRDRPLTTTWLCENERSVLLNFHPRRPSEEAWLTYAGTRVAVERTRSASGLSFASADGKVTWHEKDDEATLQFADLLTEPLRCRRQR
jgi:membrane-bound inhibitor of C-type lysozyme